MTVQSIERATCWSITINNPTEYDTGRVLPPGWEITGQFEQGEQGTHHFQGMLTTPQVRCSAVKRQFPRAHIEICRNKKALQKYVSKEDTRVAQFEANHSPNIFQWQDKIAAMWDSHDFRTAYLINLQMCPIRTEGEVALDYVDNLANRLIEQGHTGLEFISVNPMWRSAWKKFYASIITRYANASSPSRTQTSPSAPS